MWPFSRNGWPLEFSKVARPFPSLKLLKCGHFQLLMKIWPNVGYFKWFWWLFWPFDSIWMLISIYISISDAKSQRLTIEFLKRFIAICWICGFLEKFLKSFGIFFKNFHIYQEIFTWKCNKNRLAILAIFFGNIGHFWPQRVGNTGFTLKFIFCCRTIALHRVLERELIGLKN